MKASELITALQEDIDSYGDQEVRIELSGYGFEPIWPKLGLFSNHLGEKAFTISCYEDAAEARDDHMRGKYGD